ncbi:hypothetical protein HPP92_004602 [Vanilla planifolia]|uniref:AP2/ERF domain-containing protein n=1 Tax=Vanilla planifolia TaxID=51239 RepID=A0A835RX21_VANPL|nr:hypothetical protein HPP92_004602 [Vanilla planifolia]
MDYECSEGYATVSSAPPKRRAGRTKFRETRHPVYKGVRLRGAGRWVCEVREPNKKSRIWLGTFPTAEMAARAHDVAALALRGRQACLNFADSASLLPVLPSPASPRSIQRAAAQAAEAFRPPPGAVPPEDDTPTPPAEIAGPAYDEFQLQWMDFEGYGYADGSMSYLPANYGEGFEWLDDGECGGDVPLWSHSPL